MKRLYVGNLPSRATEEDLRHLFAQYGFSIGNVDVIRDRYTGESRGFGFVEIEDDEEAVRAMLILYGKELLGRPLKISEARSPRERGSERLYWRWRRRT